MRRVKTVCVPQSMCPECRVIFKPYSVKRLLAPVPGDVSVCVECGEFLVFDKELHLKLAPLDKLLGLSNAQARTLTALQYIFRHQA